MPNFWEAFYWRKCLAHGAKDGAGRITGYENQPQITSIHTTIWTNGPVFIWLSENQTPIWIPDKKKFVKQIYIVQIKSPTIKEYQMKKSTTL